MMELNRDILLYISDYSDSATKLCLKMINHEMYFFCQVKRKKVKDFCKHPYFENYPRDEVQKLKYGQLRYQSFYHAQEKRLLLKYRNLKDIKKYCLFLRIQKGETLVHCRLLAQNKHVSVSKWIRQEYKLPLDFIFQFMRGKKLIIYYSTFIVNFNFLEFNHLKLKHFIYLYSKFIDDKKMNPLMPPIIKNEEISIWLSELK